MPPNSSCMFVKDIGDQTSPCYLSSMENGQRDTIAMVRMFGSMLSIIGTTAIVASVVAKRQCCSPNVTPLFVLSIADLLLALTWLVGGGLWLRSVHSSLSWCFLTSLLNIILECVAINLTVVYAIIAHSQATQKLYTHIVPSRRLHVWHSFKTILLYMMAWCLPVLLVVVPFGVVAQRTGFVSVADNCTCWCLPIYGNVAPYAVPRTNETVTYIGNFGLFRLYTGLLLGTSYLLAFVLLVAIYRKTLRYLRKAREPVEGSLITSHNGSRQGVIYFIAAFIVCGAANFVLSYTFVFYDVHDIQKREVQKDLFLSPFPLSLLLLESLSVPLQGFLNAVVYGWTRDSFVKALVNRDSFWVKSEDDDLHGTIIEPEENSEIEREEVSVKI